MYSNNINNIGIDTTATAHIHNTRTNIALNKFLLFCQISKCRPKYIPGGLRKTKLKSVRIAVAR